MDSGTQHASEARPKPVRRFMASLAEHEVLGWLLGDHTTSGYVTGADSDTGKPKCTIIALGLIGAQFINFAMKEGSMVAFVRSQLGFFKGCDSETVAFIESFTLDDETKIMHYWDKSAQVELSESKMGELSDTWWDKGRIAQVTQTPLTCVDPELTDTIKQLSNKLTELKIKEEIIAGVIKTEFKKSKKRKAKYDARSTRKQNRISEILDYHYSEQAFFWLAEDYEDDPDYTRGDSSLWSDSSKWVTGESGRVPGASLDVLGVTGESGRVPGASLDGVDTWLLDDPVIQAMFDDTDLQKMFSEYDIQEKLDHDKDVSLVMEFAQLTTGLDTLGVRIPKK
jgi:hypothetical protein